MRRFFIFLGTATIIVTSTLISCEKDNNKDSGNNTCNVTNPAEDIGWLKEAIDNAKQDEYSYYVMANYKGETVFYYGNCNPAANYVSIIRNCNGDNLGYTNDLRDELTDKTILWKHEASKCNFQD
jgi:hypothetical protein